MRNYMGVKHSEHNRLPVEGDTLIFRHHRVPNRETCSCRKTIPLKCRKPTQTKIRGTDPEEIEWETEYPISWAIPNLETHVAWPQIYIAMVSLLFFSALGKRVAVGPPDIDYLLLSSSTWHKYNNRIWGPVTQFGTKETTSFSKPKDMNICFCYFTYLVVQCHWPWDIRLLEHLITFWIFFTFTSIFL